MKNDLFEQYLAKNEGKTLEFKENTNSLHRIIQTVIAFANTAGGVILFGIKDQTKEVVGLKNIFDDEEKLANVITDSISPL